MATYTTFDAIIDGHEGEEAALEYARGMVWLECETSESSIAYGRHIDTVDGVGVYYDYGADYYFFTDELDPDC